MKRGKSASWRCGRRAACGAGFCGLHQVELLQVIRAAGLVLLHPRTVEEVDISLLQNVALLGVVNGIDRHIDRKIQREG